MNDFAIAGALAALLLVTVLHQDLNAAPKGIAYTLSMPDPGSHIFVVTVAIDGLPPGDGHLDLALPAWRPGRYVILDLAAGVIDFSAEGPGGRPLAWSKTDKSTWRVATNGAESVKATYRVYADEFQLRTRGLDDTHGFVDPSAVFLYSEKYRGLPVTLTVDPFDGWHVTTGLDGSGTVFTATDYDLFVDCPLEIGTQKDHEFTVKGVPHVLSVYGDPAFDHDAVMGDIAKIVEAMADLWGDVPYDRYVFLLHVAPWAGGGTEHFNSTIMGTRPENLVPGEGYNGFLGLVAHEFFHTWNVKRLRPKGIVPYDYARENYVRELWISEGMTSYYDELVLVRSGFTTPDRFLRTLASWAADDRSRPGNRVQSLSEASFDAWIKWGRGGANSYNTETDFYGKGARVSLLLDLEIRRSSGGSKSLDDVLRSMYRDFPFGGPGFTVDDFQAAASRAAGSDLSAFFSKYVHGTEPLPWEESLLAAGLELSAADSAARPWTGLETRESGDRVFVSRVVEGSPARAAGLDPGDEIAAVDGIKATQRELNRALKAKKSGETAKLTIFRDNAMRECRLTLADSPVPEYRVEKMKDPPTARRELYEGWLSAKWE